MKAMLFYYMQPNQIGMFCVHMYLKNTLKKKTKDKFETKKVIANFTTDYNTHSLTPIPHIVNS